MKKTKFMALLLCVTMVLSGCGSMNNTTKGGLLGAGGGAALGAIIGGIAGKGKGAAIGAAIGTAVGAGAGVIIGKKMDKAAAEAAAIEGAQVEQVTDNNGLQAVKVTFDSGILFGTGASNLSAAAQASLSKFANNVLKQNAGMDVEIYGYTDNQGWKNSTAEQSKQRICLHCFVDAGTNLCNHFFIIHVRKNGFNHFSDFEHQVFLGTTCSDGRSTEADT